jgi:hypothetical protein
VPAGNAADPLKTKVVVEVGPVPEKEKPGMPVAETDSMNPQAEMTLETKKFDGNVMVMAFLPLTGSAFTVEKENTAVWEDLPAMRLSQEMDRATANTRPGGASPILGVGAKVVVQSLLVLTETPQSGMEVVRCKTSPQSVTV